MKDLRYGCETIALIEGSPARKTARAAEKLQTKLGDLHDAVFSIDWFEALAIDRPDLADPIDELITVQEDAASAARKGWKKELKEVDRRWRRWRG
jgi:CHAD domain-containing protein